MMIEDVIRGAVKNIAAAEVPALVGRLAEDMVEDLVRSGKLYKVLCERVGEALEDIDFGAEVRKVVKAELEHFDWARFLAVRLAEWLQSVPGRDSTLRMLQELARTTDTPIRVVPKAPAVRWWYRVATWARLRTRTSA